MLDLRCNDQGGDQVRIITTSGWDRFLLTGARMDRVGYRGCCSNRLRDDIRIGGSGSGGSRRCCSTKPRDEFTHGVGQARSTPAREAGDCPAGQVGKGDYAARRGLAGRLKGDNGVRRSGQRLHILLILTHILILDGLLCPLVIFVFCLSRNYTLYLSVPFYSECDDLS